MPHSTRRTAMQERIYSFQCKNRQQFLRANLAMGFLAQLRGCAFAGRVFQKSRQLARYWRRRVLDPTFHPGAWGGLRYMFHQH